MAKSPYIIDTSFSSNGSAIISLSNTRLVSWENMKTFEIIISVLTTTYDYQTSLKILHRSRTLVNRVAKYM